MFLGTKEEQDLYVTQTIKNLICEQTTFNISEREGFHSWHEVFGYMHEEVKELAAAHDQLKSDYVEYEALMMQDADEKHMIKALDDIVKTSIHIMKETLDIASVSMKGIHQIPKQLKEKGTCHRSI